MKINFNQLKSEGLPVINEGSYAGFHAKGMFDKVVEINQCHLQEEPSNALRKAV